MSEISDKALRELLLTLMPKDGSSIGNITLRARLAEAAKQKGLPFEEKDYFRIRQPLIAENVISTGSGKGGSVFLLRLPSEPLPELQLQGTAVTFSGEIGLYATLSRTIGAFWPEDHGFRDYIIQITGLQGKKATGGRWTRPDVTMISVWNYDYVPGIVLEVTTFEIKDTNNFDVTGVFEAAAHSVFAHRSYLAIKVTDIASSSSELERIRQECRRFGIGLILFVDPTSRDTFDVEFESRNHMPAPSAVNEFISLQIAEENKKKIREWIRS